MLASNIFFSSQYCSSLFPKTFLLPIPFLFSSPSKLSIRLPACVNVTHDKELFYQSFVSFTNVPFYYKIDLFVTLIYPRSICIYRSNNFHFRNQQKYKHSVICISNLNNLFVVILSLKFQRLIFHLCFHTTTAYISYS